MDPLCRRTLVQWVNAAQLGDTNIATLKDLRDGNCLSRLLRMIDPVKWQKEERSVYGRFAMVSKFIEEYYGQSLHLKGHYSLPVRHRINMTAITNDGDEQEIAKVLIVLLHAAINSSTCRAQFMGAALSLPNDVQEALCRQLQDIDSYKRCGSLRRLDGITTRSSSSKLARMSPTLRKCNPEFRCEQSGSAVEPSHKENLPGQQSCAEFEHTPPSAAYEYLSTISPSSPFHVYFSCSPAISEAASCGGSGKTPPTCNHRQRGRNNGRNEDAVGKLRRSLADELSRREYAEEELEEAAERYADLEAQLVALERRRRDETSALHNEIEELHMTKQQHEECAQEFAKLRFIVETEKQKNQELALQVCSLKQVSDDLCVQLSSAKQSEAEARAEVRSSFAMLLECRGALEEEKTRASHLLAALHKSEAELSSRRMTRNDSVESLPRHRLHDGENSGVDVIAGEPLSLVLEQRISELEADLAGSQLRLQEKEAFIELLQSQCTQAGIVNLTMKEQVDCKSVELDKINQQLMQIEAASECSTRDMAALKQEQEKLKADACTLACDLAKACASKMAAQDEMNKLAEQVNHVQQSLSAVESEKAAMVTQMHEQQNSNDHLSMLLGCMERQLADIKMEKSCLLESLQKQQEDADHLLQALADNERTIAELNKEKDLLMVTIGELRCTSNEKKQALDEIKIRMATICEEKDTALESLKQALTEKEHLLQLVCNAEKNVTGVTRENELLASNLHDLQTEKSQISVLLEEAERKAFISNNEKQSLLRSHADQQAEKQKLMNQLDDVLNKIACGVAEKESILQNMNTLQSEKNGLLQIVSDLEEKVSIMSAKNNSILTAVNEIQNERSQLLERADELQKRITLVSAEKDTVTGCLHAFQDEKKQLMELSNVAAQKAAAADREKCMLVDTVEELRAEKDQWMQVLNDMKTKADLAKSANDLLLERLAEQQCKAGRLEQLLHETETRLSIAVNDKESSASTVQKQEAENTELRERIHSLENNLAQSDKEKALLVQSLSQHQSDRDSMWQQQLDDTNKKWSLVNEERDSLWKTLKELSTEKNELVHQLDEVQKRMVTATADNYSALASLKEQQSGKEELSLLLSEAMEKIAAANEAQSSLLTCQRTMQADLARSAAERRLLAEENDRLAAALCSAQSEREALASECHQLQCHACIVDLLDRVEKDMLKTTVVETKLQQQQQTEVANACQPENAAAVTESRRTDTPTDCQGNSNHVCSSFIAGKQGISDLLESREYKRVLCAAEEVKADVVALRSASRALEEKLKLSEVKLAAAHTENQHLRSVIADKDRVAAACQCHTVCDMKAAQGQSQKITAELEVKLVNATQMVANLESEVTQLHDDLHHLPVGGSNSGPQSDMAEQIKVLHGKLENAKKTIDCYRSYYAQKKELVADLSRQVDLLKRDKATMSELLLKSQQDYLSMKQRCSTLTDKLAKVKAGAAPSGTGQPRCAMNVSLVLGQQAHGRQPLCSSLYGSSDVSIIDPHELSKVDRLYTSCNSRLLPTSLSYATPVKVAACEDEPSPGLEFNNIGRLAEIRRRNELCQPHLRSAYALELEPEAPCKAVDTNVQSDILAATPCRRSVPTVVDCSESVSILYKSPRRRTACMSSEHSPRAAKIRKEAENRDPVGNSMAEIQLLPKGVRHSSEPTLKDNAD